MSNNQGPGFGNVGGRSVLAWPRLFPELSAWEPRICEAAGDAAATLLALSTESNLFAVVRWDGGRVVRQHIAFDDDYVSTGEPLAIERAILANFTADVGDAGVSFVSTEGERFGALQVGDAILHAVLEHELGDPDRIGSEPIQIFEEVRDPKAVEEEVGPTSASGGVQLLRTLVSKGQLELAADADLRKMDLGIAPFLEPSRDSYEAAEALIDWLIEQPGVEEVYIEPEHLAKLLARW